MNHPNAKRATNRTPPAPLPRGSHDALYGLLADASQRQLSALRHLLTCPLCLQLARVVLLELPTLERAGSNGRRRRRRRHHPFHHRS